MTKQTLETARPKGKPRGSQGRMIGGTMRGFAHSRIAPAPPEPLHRDTKHLPIPDHFTQKFWRSRVIRGWPLRQTVAVTLWRPRVIGHKNLAPMVLAKRWSLTVHST
jgi:hypothetical protein